MIKQFFYKFVNRGRCYIVLGLVLSMIGCSSPVEEEPILTCEPISMDEYAYIVSESDLYGDSLSLYTECAERTYFYWKITYIGTQEGISFNFGFVGASSNDSWTGLIEESLCDFHVTETERKGTCKYAYTVANTYKDIVHINHSLNTYITGSAWIQVDQTNWLTGKTNRFWTGAITFWYPDQPPLS